MVHWRKESALGTKLTHSNQAIQKSRYVGIGGRLMSELVWRFGGRPVVIAPSNEQVPSEERRCKSWPKDGSREYLWTPTATQRCGKTLEIAELPVNEIVKIKFEQQGSTRRSMWALLNPGGTTKQTKVPRSTAGRGTSIKSPTFWKWVQIVHPGHILNIVRSCRFRSAIGGKRDSKGSHDECPLGSETALSLKFRHNLAYRTPQRLNWRVWSEWKRENGWSSQTTALYMRPSSRVIVRHLNSTTNRYECLTCVMMWNEVVPILTSDRQARF